MPKSDIFMLLGKIDHSMKAAVDASLKSHNLTFSQLNVLFFVCKSGGTVSQKQIEEYLKVSHPTVVGLVQRLEAAGYIVCERDEKDKRNKLVTNTAEFDRLVSELERMKQESHDKILAGFSEQELMELSASLNRIYTNIKNERNNCL